MHTGRENLRFDESKGVGRVTPKIARLLRRDSTDRYLRAEHLFGHWVLTCAVILTVWEQK